ncbi:DUF1801 domain-containing protein [Herminiimonas sp. KBW02]|uniref:DUF1801 domain-containing protein n=1 Tax=Herminiimonas sp. KBW02 TaxID=2153363 RepID=UPI000F5A79A9|nr:DUF1801 domain-containing protein [Herminiimonas sp. KBW02]RQO33545.1 DUF1801 domain-containing protein [Herminiimonas sp. KBW02]
MTDARVEQLLNDIRLVNPERYELVVAARRVIQKEVKQAMERVMYGGFMFAAPLDFCGVFAYAEHISIEFGRGCDLQDAWQVLEGKGKLRRHIKIHSPDEIKSKHLADYVRQAFANVNT